MILKRGIKYILAVVFVFWAIFPVISCAGNPSASADNTESDEGKKLITIDITDAYNYAKFGAAYDWSSGKQGAQIGYLLDVALTNFIDNPTEILGKQIQVIWKVKSDREISSVRCQLLDTSKAANWWRDLSDTHSVKIPKGEEFTFDKTFEIKKKPAATVVLRMEMTFDKTDGVPVFKSDSFVETEIPESEKFASFNGKDYELTFYDDFSSPNLDLSKWSRCAENERQNVGGWWRDKCSYIEDGILVLKSQGNGGKLESGAVETKSKFEQVQGMYKIRFKVGAADGLWHAFWLMYDNASDKDGKATLDGEIDVFEVISNDPWAKGDEKRYLNSALHWDGYGDSHKSKGTRYFIEKDFFDAWHEVTFIWDDDGYHAYLDGDATPYWDAKYDDGWGGKPESPHHIIISTEFGTWNGKVNESQLPTYFYVDWVKVYKLSVSK